MSKNIKIMLDAQNKMRDNQRRDFKKKTIFVSIVIGLWAGYMTYLILS